MDDATLRDRIASLFPPKAFFAHRDNIADAVMTVLGPELTAANKRYETAFEGRQNAWDQLEKIAELFGHEPADIEITAVASLVEFEMTGYSASIKRLRAERDRFAAPIQNAKEGQ